MNEPEPASAPEDIQFDEAAYDEAGPRPAVTCKACGQPIDESYHVMNGLVVCEACRGSIERAWYGGSRLLRVVRATALGAGAAVVGFAIYYGIGKLTGYSFSLISILIGIMVGGAVHKESGGRGGWVYQLIAVFLTYSAIVADYVPDLVVRISQSVREEQAWAEANPNAGGEPRPAAAPGAAPARAPLSGSQKAAIFILAVTLAYKMPFLLGFQDVMGLLILGFGLLQAWRMNKRATLQASGPFLVGDGPPPLNPGATQHA